MNFIKQGDQSGILSIQLLAQVKYTVMDLNMKSLEQYM